MTNKTKRSYFEGYATFKRQDLNIVLTIEEWRGNTLHVIKNTMRPCQLNDIADELHSIIKSFQRDIDLFKSSMRGEQ